jgi:transposase
VSADGASWIAKVVGKRCPQAVLCTDPFHVVQWATDALDEVRREVWNVARHGRQPARARELMNARWVLWRNQEDLTDRQEAKLAIIARTNKPLYRAYLLKEQLRLIFQIPDVAEARAVLDGWIGWARRSRLLASSSWPRRSSPTGRASRPPCFTACTSARVEAANTNVRLIIRRGFGFHSPKAVIALAMLSLGGLCPPLSGRA